MPGFDLSTILKDVGGFVGSFGKSEGGKKALSSEQQALFRLLLAHLPQYDKMIDTYSGRQLGYADQLDQFLAKYMNEGSPLLERQRAGVVNDVASAYNGASGKLNQQLATRGYGFTPSGVNAAALGDLGREESQTMSDKFLEKILNDEKLRFDAAHMKGSEISEFNPSAFISGANSTQATASSVTGNPAAGPGLLSSIMAGFKGFADANATPTPTP